MKNIEQLVAARIEAKRIEDEAVAARRLIDADIADAMRSDKVEGTESLKLTEMGVKLSVNYALNRRVDSQKLIDEWDNIPANVQGIFKFKAEVAVSALRKADSNELVAAAQYFDTAPASPSIKIEFI